MYLGKLDLSILRWEKLLIRDARRWSKNFFKKPENIKGKNEELLEEIKNQGTKESGNKDSQTDKTKISLIYDPNYNVYKYTLDISLIPSKFDMLGMFYREFIGLKSPEARTKKNTNHKFVVLNKASNEYDKLIKECKKVYEREPKDDKSYG